MFCTFDNIQVDEERINEILDLIYFLSNNSIYKIVYKLEDVNNLSSSKYDKIRNFINLMMERKMAKQVTKRDLRNMKNNLDKTLETVNKNIDLFAVLSYANTKLLITKNKEYIEFVDNSNKNSPFYGIFCYEDDLNSFCSLAKYTEKIEF